MIRRLSTLFLAASLLGSVACGNASDQGSSEAGSGGEDSCRAPYEQTFSGVEAYPVFASSDVSVGSNRFLVGLLNDDDAPIGAPDIEMEIEFVDLTDCPAEPGPANKMDFVWSIKPDVGLYRTDVEFDSAGTWGAEVKITGDGLNETVKASFDVAKEPVTPAIGDPAPTADTPTADDVKDLSQISTDAKPVPRFYAMSVAEALKKGKPFVVAFSTPKFCQTQTCGPTLEVVKSVAGDFPKLTFIHVEPYELPADPAALEPVAAVEEWGLPSEPWVFVVDGDGKVAAKYEGALAAEELKEALADL
ncbi:MAG: thioredoxin family protein [Actinomycetota bacterium]|nr:thioredoxin family protein [Actinomycetota bacterium]